MARDPADILAALAGAKPIRQRLLIVVAHPDDETVGMGAQLCRLRGALLLHVTDGAPRDGEDARGAGFTDPAEYAAARRSELAAALAAGDAQGIRTMRLGLADQEACRELVRLVNDIAAVLRRERPAAVVTHAYEGGHPDHDATAFAVHGACQLTEDGSAPSVIEMPLYHADRGRLVAGRFLPADSAGVTIPLRREARRRKRRMVACFQTQRRVLSQFDLRTERFRLAPTYNFAAPPHPGTLIYETFGWRIDAAAEWRRNSAAALAELGLA